MHHKQHELLSLETTCGSDIKVLQAMNYSGKKVVVNVRNSYYITTKRSC